MRTVLIPAAGFGKRVGSPPAKELLPDPETGAPLIEHSLGLAATCGAKPVIITRRSKTALINFIHEQQRDSQQHPAYRNCELLILDETSEWPDTLLQSSRAWGTTNVVILPDTRFQPTQIIEQLFCALEANAQLAFGTFSVEDLAMWGGLQTDGTVWYIAEKPRTELSSSAPIAGRSQPSLAWGIFGFREELGVNLFQTLLASSADHGWKKLPAYPVLLPLSQFCDLTR